MKQKLAILASKFKGLFPEKLPTGTKDFEAFTSSIFKIYGLPDLPSYRNAIATMVMHLGPTEDKKSKAFFAKSLRRRMANQIAYEIILKIRDEEKNESVATEQSPEAAQQIEQASEENKAQ